MLPTPSPSLLPTPFLSILPPPNPTTSLSSPSLVHLFLQSSQPLTFYLSSLPFSHPPIWQCSNLCRQEGVGTVRVTEGPHVSYPTLKVCKQLRLLLLKLFFHLPYRYTNKSFLFCCRLDELAPWYLSCEIKNLIQSRINWTICVSFGTYDNSVRLHEDWCSLGWILYWYKTVPKVHHWYKPKHCLQLNTCKPNYKVYNHFDNQLISSHLGVRLAEVLPPWNGGTPAQ